MGGRDKATLGLRQFDDFQLHAIWFKRFLAVKLGKRRVARISYGPYLARIRDYCVTLENI